MNRFSRILTGKQTGEQAPASQPIHPADPRPDIEEDHKLWDTVLRAAWDMHRGDNPVYGLLHGLRCGGARLHLRDKGRLHMDYTPLCDCGWTKEQLLEKWLKPNTQAIKAVFARAEAALAGLPPGQTLPAWAR